MQDIGQAQREPRGQDENPALSFCGATIPDVPTVRDVLDALESIAPSRFALSWDRIGLQVGDPAAPVTKAVVTLDASREAIQFATIRGAQMIVAHHPLIFRPLDNLRFDQPVSGLAARLIQRDIALAAVHTNWDAAPGGVNDELAVRLGLQGVSAFGQAAESNRLKVAVCCPVGTEQATIDAAAGAGAGLIGAYQRCAFLGKGVGTFLPGPAASPTIGVVGEVQHVDEIRLEMIVRTEDRAKVDAAVRRTHTYEEPAIDWFVLASAPAQPLGRVGDLAEALHAEDFRSWVDDRLGTRSFAWNMPSSIQRIAVIGGAGDSDWYAARGAGADVLVTGEVKHHTTVEAAEVGLVAAGHYATEQPGCEALANRLSGALPSVDWSTFAPDPGSGGRPR